MFTASSFLRALPLALILSGATGASLAQSAAKEAPASNLPDLKATYETASGKYGTNVTSTSHTSSVTASWSRDNYAVDVEVPYLSQSGPSRRVVIGAGRQVIVDSTASAAGLGDITIDYTRYLLDQEAAGVDLDIAATVKLPTASASKGLGTGKTDLSLEGTLARAWGVFSAAATLGYTWVGRPAGLDYHNVVFGSIDASVRTGEITRLGATYSAQQSITAGAPGTRDLMLYVECKLTKRLRAEVHVSKGYSTQSADRAVGVSGTLSF